tara:strand:+ start:877 stop:1053 length:177 start_codon:yes stop_codon:yes gene_type:complete
MNFHVSEPPSNVKTFFAELGKGTDIHPRREMTMTRILSLRKEHEKRGRVLSLYLKSTS